MKTRSSSPTPSKNKMKNVHRIALVFSLVAVFAVVCSLCGCQGNGASSKASSSAEGARQLTNTMTDASANVSVAMNQQTSGAVSVDRPTREVAQAMGTDDTWTVFVYMCGSDLESENGCATDDLNEMKAASTGENVQFVVQAGGSKEWKSSVVKAGSNSRIVVKNGKMTSEPIDKQNMGEASTLADFVSWGVGAYPAAHMGLVFWDHGGGSLAGVCTDETADDDTLTLREIDSALLSVYPEMTCNFDFIGFDACLMSTLETANTAASYADYMFASEDLESGNGWDYTAVGTYLGKNANTTNADLGKVVADSYYAACEETGEAADATMTVCDLSKTDGLVSAFGEFSYKLYNTTQNTDSLTAYVREALKADNFGGNNTIEGYTNMADLSGLVKAADNLSVDTGAVEAALGDLVVYNVNGANHPKATGLATYWPLDFQGNDEISTYSQVATSPYYLALVDRSAYCGTFGKTLADYPDGQALEAWGSCKFDVSDNGNYTLEGEKEPSYWAKYDKEDEQSPFVSFEQKPAINSDSSYSFKLTPEALKYTAKVEACIDQLGETDEDTLELGYSTRLSMDWETGTFADQFDGKWVSLPDGQQLAIYSVAENYDEGFDVYTPPVMVNDEGTNLRIIHNWKDNNVTIDGVWDGVYENGVSPRITNSLEKGDKIVPYYYAPYATSSDSAAKAASSSATQGGADAQGTDATDSGELIFEGEAFKYKGSPDLKFVALQDGEYSYCFVIQDIFGNMYYTDPVLYEVENGTGYFVN